MMKKGGLYLASWQMYNNGINILNNICKELYSKKGVATARSVNESDLKKHGFSDNSLKTVIDLKIDSYAYDVDSKNPYPIRLDSSDYVGSNISKAEAWSAKVIDDYIIGEQYISMKENDVKKVVATNLDFKKVRNATDTALLYWDSTAEEFANYWIPKIIINKKGEGHGYYRINFSMCYVLGNRTGASVTFDQYNDMRYHTSNHGIRAVVELDADLLVNNAMLSVYDGSAADKAIQLIY